MFTALIAQSFSRSLLLADYLVNVEAYKKQCVNKAKPMLHCNGKCQMLKKLKKQEGDNGTNLPAPKFNQLDLVFSVATNFPVLVILPFDTETTFYTYNSLVASNYIGSIFHPPGA